MEALRSPSVSAVLLFVPLGAGAPLPHFRLLVPCCAITMQNSLATVLSVSVMLPLLKRGYLHCSLARFNGKISN